MFTRKKRTKSHLIDSYLLAIAENKWKSSTNPIIHLIKNSYNSYQFTTDFFEYKERCMVQDLDVIVVYYNHDHNQFMCEINSNPLNIIP